jgi:putative ABC transport system permease protein
LKETVARIKREYNRLFPGNPFDTFFLDDYFNQQYKSDELLGNVFTLFSSLALIITTLGILGLSAYSASQRIKEIAIRKVLGASVKKILSLILKDFMRLLVLAFVLILPVLFISLNSWLNGFALRMKLNSLIFLIPYLFVTLITAITVIIMTIKAASINPVQTLKYE